ncbi:MAG: MarR family transcriptional regulator [Oscillospiraceae bacterium]|nr:MarR family transcriptional regulator [Oscillospiraceae bacterium]
MKEYSDIVRNVMIIHKYFRLYFKDCFKKYDINSAEAMVILMLCGKTAPPENDLFKIVHSGSDGATQEQLIGELHFDKSVMTRTIQSLEAKGYVTRENNPADSRSFLISPSPRALDLKPVIDEVLENWDKMMLENIDDIKAVSRAISRMAQNIRSDYKGE